MKKEIVYDVDYFINKFEAIPEHLWCQGSFTHSGAHCALGHCNVTGSDINDNGEIRTEEGKALAQLLKVMSKETNEFRAVYIINDEYPSSKGPKKNILDALYKVKKLQNKEQKLSRKDITKELAILPVNETSDLIDKDKKVLI